MTKRSACAALLATLLTFAVDAQPPIPTATAEVVAWNLAGFDPIPRDRVPRFAEAMARLDPEVLALVEVNPDFVAGELVAELNELNLCYKRKILPQSAHQNIAVLHKCSVTVTNPRFIPGSDDGNPDLRKALAVDVELGEFDFFLVALHLKSGRSTSERQTRERQTTAIRSFVTSTTQGAEKDVLIVGDYNMIPGQDVSNFTSMNPGNFLRFLTSELASGAFSHITQSGNPGNLLDGFAISRDHTDELVAGSIHIVPMHTDLGLSLHDFGRDVSDHLPVIARFSITTDDD